MHTLYKRIMKSKYGNWLFLILKKHWRKRNKSTIYKKDYETENVTVIGDNCSNKDKYILKNRQIF